MERKKRSKKWNHNSMNRKNNYRYIEYYEKMMAPILAQRWEADLKRLKLLKKNILSLGPIPQKKVQIIKTVNYFVKILDLLTSFLDDGLLTCSPADKAEDASFFNDMVQYLVGRDESDSCYLNKTEIGKTVTINSLYLGLFIEISADEIEDGMKIRKYNDKIFQVEVDFVPISVWLNNRVITMDGNSASISQNILANLLKEMSTLLIGAIDNVLLD